MNSCFRNPLDSRQLRAFITLARTGSFTAAAKELHLTQSAVSHAMKALEADVGCRLLDRMGKKVLLTQAGEQFLERAGKIFAEMSEARAELEALGEWGNGRLRIGASAAACQYVLPRVLREFKRKFPKCRLQIVPTAHGPNTVIIRARQHVSDVLLATAARKTRPQLTTALKHSRFSPRHSQR